jgi:hypothetical protein
VRHIATSPSTNKGTHAKDTTDMALSEAHRAGYPYHTTLPEQRQADTIRRENHTVTPRGISTKDKKGAG